MGSARWVPDDSELDGRPSGQRQRLRWKAQAARKTLMDSKANMPPCCYTVSTYAEIGGEAPVSGPHRERSACPRCSPGGRRDERREEGRVSTPSLIRRPLVWGKSSSVLIDGCQTFSDRGGCLPPLLRRAHSQNSLRRGVRPSSPPLLPFHAPPRPR